jgi:hypothetical protein
MNKQGPFSGNTPRDNWLSRRNLIRGVAGAALGAGLIPPKSAHAHDDEDSHDARCNHANPIPGGGAPFKPFGIFVHHNPLNPLIPLANIHDPSQITDFDGFVGLTNIHGGGTGIDTVTGIPTPLAFRADMGFSKGTFVGTDGRRHKGTFAFV